MNLRPALLVPFLSLGVPLPAAGPWAPPPGLQLHAEEASFAGTVTVGERVSRAESSMAVERQGDAWTLRELASLSGVQTLETTTVGPDGAVRSRRTRQGENGFTLAYAQGRVTGTFASEGSEAPVKTDLGGEAFGDGACAGMVLSALPLAEGYQTEFRSFNLRGRKAVTRKLRVAGLETVKVPAGTFRAWKAVVTNAEGEPGSTTVWSEVGTRRLVRYELRMKTADAEILVVQERQ